MSTNIPEARRILQHLLDTSPYLHADTCEQLMSALDLMTRTVRGKRFNPNRITMTPSIGEEARRLHRTTKMTNAEIGEQLGVDGGRVS